MYDRGRPVCPLLALSILVAASGAAGAKSVRLAADRPGSRPSIEATKRARARTLLGRAGVRYPAPRLYLRAFKAERQLELWAGSRDRREALRLIKVYRICASSGVLGPKRRQGDRQVPEGFYRLTRFTRHSRFHRSLRLSYPNRLDRLRGHTGGAILVHGKCCTIGCIPIEDGPIEELFRIADATRRRFRRAVIPIHVFPLRMDRRGMKRLAGFAAGNRRLADFWRDLEPGYRLFEQTRRVPRVSVTRDRRYRVTRPRP